MAYVTLDFNVGMFANGTAYKNRQSWRSGSRVRWFGGVPRTMGGWERYTAATGQPLDPLVTDPVTQAVRAILGWKTNDGSMLYVAGHNEGLVAWRRSSNTVFDITPAGFTPRQKDYDIQSGYGNWFYGSDSYGTERPYEPSTTPTFNWCFRNWGENLLAAERGQPSNLYEWDGTLATVATVVPNAPEDFDCFHVTGERIVMTAGTGTDQRLVQWSDSENNQEWTPAVNNQAGFQRLPGIGRFRDIVNVADHYLLLSETDAYAARYLGPPFVYGFVAVGEDCGVVSPAAVIAAKDRCFWPGQREFFMYNGTLQKVECPIMDRFAKALSGPQVSKMVGFLNSEWSECWWLYQSEDGSEVDSYIVFGYDEGYWIDGKLNRTAGGVSTALFGPLMVDHGGVVFRHDVPNTAPVGDDDFDVAELPYGEYTPSMSPAPEPKPIWLLTNPMDIGNGKVAYVSYINPDFETEGAVDIYLLGQDRPGGPINFFGPYVCDFPAGQSQPIPVRARGMLISALIQSDSSNFTLGSLRLDVQVGGGR